MKLTEAKQKFINSWGALGSEWGINRTMAQIHALLLISIKPLNQDEIMTELSISRGNVNMNIRDLIDWGLIERTIIAGERKEYFIAEKDIYKVAVTIIKERKRRELDNLLKLLDQLKDIDSDKKDPETKEFVKIISDINTMSLQADSLLNKLITLNENKFFSTLLKAFK